MQKLIIINIENNKCRLTGHWGILDKLREKFKYKHPQAFYIRNSMPRGWDGFIRPITESGYIKTGHLPMLLEYIEKLEKEEQETIEVEYVDNRDFAEFKRVPKYVGSWELRGYQREAVKNVISNTLGELPYRRGIIAAATNAGKTLIAAGLFFSFRNTKAVILLNNFELYKQFIQDMPKICPGFGYIQGSNVKWGNPMICMVQSLVSKWEKYKYQLADTSMVLVDECHLSTSKTYRTVLTGLFNADIRVGLSGTPLKHKDITKNMEVRSYFGEIVYTISNRELVDGGWSTEPIIKILPGNTTAVVKGDYDEEYRLGITTNVDRHNKSLRRVNHYLHRKKYPILVVAKYHEHIYNLYNHFRKNINDKYSIAFIHHTTTNRTAILNKFKEGKIDVLIASMIIKIGQNMPLIRYMQNAGGGDSAINTLQLLGRSIRKHASKNRVYYEDFADEGYYLKRHSKHRIRDYKNEKFKVVELYKNTIIK